MVEAHTPRDVLADDGTAIRRGYIEVILEGQDAKADPTATTSVTIALLDQKSRKEKMIDYKDFPSRIPIALERDQRRKLAFALMNRLTNTLQISVFTDDLEDYDEQLNRFEKYLQEATVETIIATNR
ncbi:MAG TPA: hypothetical protein VNF68_11620 [Candidatus Baltobacteraceae bacterium]|nr:hypothetical protein [Candidatus Baltobacteraceae bacterium]